MSKGNSKIFVNFTVEAHHCWRQANGENAFLENPQRHLFEVRIDCLANHNDVFVTREELLNVSRSLLKGGNWGDDSCEAVAERLAGALYQKYQRPLSVQLGTTNNEFGAYVEFTASQQ